MPSSSDIDAALLHRLLTVDTHQTPDGLGRELGAPGEDIAERVEGLRAAGCVIDSHPRHGVRLVSSGLGCWADYIEHRHAGRLGRRLSVYRQTASTQDAARRLVSGPGGAERHAGRVVVADHQTAGRGRLGRRWSAPPGAALLLTVIVERRGAGADRFVVGSSCAAAEAVEQLTGISPRIRWPNDLLIGDAKLAGILVETVGGAVGEMVGGVALVGIGINVSARPDQLPISHSGTPGKTHRAVCLREHGSAVDRLRLLDVLRERREHNLHETSADELHAAWKERSSLVQRRITVMADRRRLTGRVLDLDPTHGLVLQLDHGGLAACPAATTSLIEEA